MKQEQQQKKLLNRNTKENKKRWKNGDIILIMDIVDRVDRVDTPLHWKKF